MARFADLSENELSFSLQDENVENTKKPPRSGCFVDSSSNVVKKLPDKICLISTLTFNN